ncbi:hypothetical protein [Treponema sp.]|uniref:hypothetical protein n=1 Tax=Treponema sp. TaxID=166 RepID=UPI00388E3E94
MKTATIIFIGFILFTTAVYSSKKKTEDQFKVIESNEQLAAFITKDRSYLILDNTNKKIIRTESKYQFFRRISYITKNTSISEISIYAEGNTSPVSFFDDLLEDSTIAEEISFDTKGNEFYVRIKFLEHPSEELNFRICM